MYKRQLLYCALLGYIIFEGSEEERNMNTLVDMISGMEVKEDDEDFLNAVDYMFKGLEQRKPNCFAVKQYKKYKLSSGVAVSYTHLDVYKRQEVYHGIEDIPAEHRIFAYPKLNIREQMAAYKEVIDRASLEGERLHPRKEHDDRLSLIHICQIKELVRGSVEETLNELLENCLLYTSIISGFYPIIGHSGHERL